MGFHWDPDLDTLASREREDHWFGHHYTNYDATDAYEPNDPKNPAYAEGLVDWADAERKRAQGE